MDVKQIIAVAAVLALLLTACTAGAPADSEVPSAIAAQTPAPTSAVPTETPVPTNAVPTETSAPADTAPVDTSDPAPTETAPHPESAAPSQKPDPIKPTEEQESDSMTIIINGQTFLATLYDNETAAALKEKLPLTLDMSELNGNEKYNYLPFSLPANAGNPGQIHAGDLMLYGSDCLVLFYEGFSTGYRYTPVGRINDPAGLADAVGGGGVQVAFTLG